MKKKIIAFMLLATLTVTIIACGGPAATPSADTQAGEAEQVESQADADSDDSQKEEPLEDTQKDDAQEDEQTTENGTGTEISSENQQLIMDTMQAIYDVAPGTAGSSIRQAKAVAMLLDLAETLTDQANPDQIIEIAQSWAKDNDEIEGAFDEAYLNVWEEAFNIVDNPAEGFGDSLEDSGYELKYDKYTKAYLEYVCNYLELSRATGE